MNALGVLVELGPASPPTDGFYLGHLTHEALGDKAEPVRLGERDAGLELQRDQQCAFVEGRQEGPRQQRCRKSRRSDRERDRREQEVSSAESRVQEALLSRRNLCGVVRAP